MNPCALGHAFEGNVIARGEAKCNLSFECMVSAIIYQNCMKIHVTVSSSCDTNYDWFQLISRSQSPG